MNHNVNPGFPNPDSLPSGSTMARKSPQWVCQSCNATALRWTGRCPACGQWNTLVEVAPAPPPPPGAADATAPPATTTSLRDARLPGFERVDTGFAELNSVLGGGLVPGSVVLLGGDPGIGKSTLLLQAAANLLERRARVLYVAGEENPAQIALRSRRLQTAAADLLVTTECCVESIAALVQQNPPDAIIVDSIQTVYSLTSTSTPGSIQQLRACTALLTTLAKSLDIPTILVGHVTRTGSIAGPRAVEHLVDTVLYLEGDPGTPLRILRGVKNRFGSTLEVGILQMTRDGLRDAPSSVADVPALRGPRPAGIAITAITEGTRAFNVEIQALVAPAAWGPARLHCIGVDSTRVQMITAIMERHCGDSIAGADVYVTVTGGFRLQEPAGDLALAAAIASSFRNRPIAGSVWLTGELALTGDVRDVPNLPSRLGAAHRAGYTRILAPASVGAEELPSASQHAASVQPIRSLKQVFELLFDPAERATSRERTP